MPCGAHTSRRLPIFRAPLFLPFVLSLGFITLHATDASVEGLRRAAGGDGNRLLRDLTAATGGRLYESPSTEELPGVFVRIVNEFRDRYVLSYSPSGVSGTGWHTIRVRVKRRGATVRARPGYAIGE